ncbi:MAG: hypothetical protein GY822_22265, partial [Deltaproteobacteria bacterium]|nr:hypothetical protein [Deltaproteobacteria bacterium]
IVKLIENSDPELVGHEEPNLRKPIVAHFVGGPGASDIRIARDEQIIPLLYPNYYGEEDDVSV